MGIKYPIPDWITFPPCYLAIPNPDYLHPGAPETLQVFPPIHRQERTTLTSSMRRLYFFMIGLPPPPSLEVFSGLFIPSPYGPNPSLLCV